MDAYRPASRPVRRPARIARTLLVRNAGGWPGVRRSRFVLALLLAVIASSACHTYRTIPSGPLPADGTPLALHLTDSGAVALAREVGPSVELLEGNLVRADGESVTLAVRRVRMRDGLSNAWAGEHVVVSRALIASVSERRLSRVRSLLFAGGILAGAALGATGATGIVGGGRGGRGNPGGER